MQTDKYSIEEVLAIKKQLEQIEFERLQHKTIVPTVYLQELVENPSIYNLAKIFFKCDSNDTARKKEIEQALIELQDFAFEYVSGECDCEKEYQSFKNGDEPFSFSLLGCCLIDNKDIYIKISKLAKLDCKEIKLLFDIIADKACSLLFFQKGFYEMAFFYNNSAFLLYGYALKALNLPSENRARAKKRWGNHVPNLRHKYLKIFQEQGFTTYAKCAMWIYENDNEENLDFDTIRKHLSKADKKNFTN